MSRPERQLVVNERTIDELMRQRDSYWQGWADDAVRWAEERRRLRGAIWVLGLSAGFLLFGLFLAGIGGR